MGLSCLFYPFRNFDSEFLTCDCGMQWVPGFFRTSSARLGDETLCMFPRRFQNRPLRELKDSDLTCGERIRSHFANLAWYQNMLRSRH